MTLRKIDEIRGRLEAATPETVWKAIPGYPDYEVSERGEVRSYLFPGNSKQTRLANPRIMGSGTSHNGYRTVALKNPNGGKAQTKTVHRLVLLTFVGPCPEGTEACHLNGNRLDNRLVNLKWDTHRNNENHKRAHGTWFARRSNTTLEAWQAAETKYLVTRGITQAKVARLFGVSRQIISDICRGHTWSDIERRPETLSPTDIAFLLDLCAKQGAVVSAVSSHWVSQRHDRSCDKAVFGLDATCDCWTGPILEALTKLDAVEVGE